MECHPQPCSQYKRSVQPGENPDRLGCRVGRSGSKARAFLPGAEGMLPLTFFELLEEPLGTITRCLPTRWIKGILFLNRSGPASCVYCLCSTGTGSVSRAGWWKKIPALWIFTVFLEILSLLLWNIIFLFYNKHKWWFINRSICLCCSLCSRTTVYIGKWIASFHISLSVLAQEWLSWSYMFLGRVLLERLHQWCKLLVAGLSACVCFSLRHQRLLRGWLGG